MLSPGESLGIVSHYIIIQQLGIPIMSCIQISIFTDDWQNTGFFYIDHQNGKSVFLLQFEYIDLIMIQGVWQVGYVCDIHEIVGMSNG